MSIDGDLGSVHRPGGRRRSHRERQSQTVRKRSCDLNLTVGHPRPLILFHTVCCVVVKLILPLLVQKGSEKSSVTVLSIHHHWDHPHRTLNSLMSIESRDLTSEFLPRECSSVAPKIKTLSQIIADTHGDLN